MNWIQTPLPELVQTENLVRERGTADLSAMNRIVFTPKHGGFVLEDIAMIFATYLLGVGNFQNKIVDGEHTHGPWWIKAGEKWQLDSTNNYWVREKSEQEFMLTCRMPAQNVTESRIHAMYALFNLQYN